MAGARKRDRDDSGRPQSGRPRDSLGRPLPRGSKNEHEPPSLPDDPVELLRIGVDFFDAGRFFDAHETWETAWHPAPTAERDFWQGITQIAVGFTHWQRENPRGAITLLRRGAARLDHYPAAFRRFPAGRLASEARVAADLIERDGLGAHIVPPKINRDQ